MTKAVDAIGRLRNNPAYRDALRMAPDRAARELIIGTCEGFLSSLERSIAVIRSSIGVSSEGAAALAEELGGGAVVTPAEEATRGNDQDG